MSTQAWQKAGALAAAAFALLLVVPQGGTAARWVEAAETTQSGKLSEFTVTHEQSEALGPVWDVPTIKLTNKSSHRAVVKPDHLTLNITPHSATLGRNAYIAYRLGLKGACYELGAHVWPSAGGWISHGFSNGDGFTAWNGGEFRIDPGQTVILCPQVALGDKSDTPDEQRLIILKYGGAAIRLTTDFTWRTEAQATWSKSERTASTYRIRFPNITAPAPGCGNASLYANFTSIRWRWPNDQLVGINTTAVQHWEAWFKSDNPANSTWQKVSGKVPHTVTYDRIWGTPTGDISSHDRELWLNNHSFGANWGDAWSGKLRIRAVLDGPNNVWVQSTDEISLSYPGTGHVKCDGVTAIPRETSNLP